MTATAAAVAAAVAAVLHARASAPAILARIAGSAGRVARAEAVHLAGLSRVARARALAERIAELRMPVPVGLPLVHREWIEAALVGEGERVRAIVTGGAAVSPPVRVWLERRAYGAIAPIPLPDEGAPLSPATLAHRPPGWIEEALRRAGLRTLAHAVADTPRVAVAAVAARLGAEGPELVAAVAAIAAGDGVAAGLGSRRAAVRRVAGVAVGADPLALVAIGARALAPHLTEVALQVAQRLPRAIGLRVLDEIAAFGGDDADAAERPSWQSLVIP